MKLGFALLLPLGLAACGSIDSVPLNPDGVTALKNAEHGIRYYQPAPYLLVMDLPASSNPNAGTTPGAPTTAELSVLAQAAQNAKAGEKLPQILADAQVLMAKGGAGGGGASNTGQQNQGGQNTAQSPQTAGPSSSGSDTSFSGTAATYVVKLVYLPDLAHPFTLQMTPGLFNSVSMQPTLVDGWMFSSLSGSVDNTALPAAIASAIGGGGGSSKASGVSAAAKTPAAAAAMAMVVTAAQTSTTSSLTPDQLTAAGAMAGEGQAPPLDPATLNALDASQLATYVQSLAAAMGGKQIGQPTLLSMSKPALIVFASGLGSIAQQQQPQQNLLPPGLYGFDYTTKGRVFCGISPVVLFQQDGSVIAPDRKQASDYAYCGAN